MVFFLVVFTASALEQGLLSHYSALWYRLAQRTPPTVVAGADDWLFSREHVQLRDPAALERGSSAFREQAVRIAQRFQEAGIKLVVVYIPQKSRIYADKIFPENPGPAEIPAAYDNAKTAFLERMRQAGAEVVDLTDSFEELRERGVHPYFRDDHHWSWQGVQAAADLVRIRVAQRWPQLALGPERAAYEMGWEPAPERIGSYLRKLRLPEDSALHERLRADQPRPVFRIASGPKVPAFARATEPAALETRFPERNVIWPASSEVATAAPILAVSSSFGRFDWDRFLANATGREVDGMVTRGRGSRFAPLLALVRRLSDPERPLPELVVWDMPEYHARSARPDLAVPAIDRRRFQAVAAEADFRGFGGEANGKGFHPLRHGRQRLSVTLAEPARELRLWFDTPKDKRSQCRIGVTGRKKSFMLLAGHGPAPYPVRFEAPVTRIELTVDCHSRQLISALKFTRAERPVAPSRKASRQADRKGADWVRGSGKLLRDPP